MWRRSKPGRRRHRIEIPSLDLRSDHRKAASSAYRGGKLMAGAKEALATMMKSWEGMSGGRIEIDIMIM